MAAWRCGAALRLCATVILLDMAFCKGIVQDLDDSFKDSRKSDIWLVDFYAPWCGHCKKLEPIWNEVGLEMKNIGSPVKVGKMDATSHSSVASEFGVRGYPTIKLLKGDLAYSYRGPRTKDDIVEFAHRVSGEGFLCFGLLLLRMRLNENPEIAETYRSLKFYWALIRPLPSQQMFEHVQRRHRVFFVYVGGESTLKEKYIDVASELIIYTYFYSALEDVVPEYVKLKEIPAVLVFKDGSYFVYDEYEDGDLSAWINRERFQNYIAMDGFVLYELGDTGKLVAIAVIDEKNSSLEHTRLKSIIQDVAGNFRGQFHRDLQFGHMDGNEYINTLLMDELSVPTVVVLNTSNQQYFLLDRQIKSPEDMVQFIHSILDGRVEAQGGDSIFHRLKRILFDAKSTVVSIFKSSPLMGCFLFGLPLGVISVMCYGIYTADADGGYIEERYELSKDADLEGADLLDEAREPQEVRNGNPPMPPEPEPEPKGELDKKRD